MKKASATKTKSPGTRKIVVVAMSGNTLLYIAGPTDVFFLANRFLLEQGIANAYSVQIVSPGAGKHISTETGIDIQCKASAIEFTGDIDTLIIAGNDFRPEAPELLKDFYAWLATRNQSNTRRIASICGGAFALARSGILEGREATTHWALAEKLKRSYPGINVNPNPFFINNDGHIYTSAGVTTGIDLAIAMVEQDYGKDIALRVARRLVFYLNRPGLQTQFGSLIPEYGHEPLAKRVQGWLRDHLHEQLDVERVADQMNMSTRNFTRVFTKESGMPPAKFIEKLRVEAARKFLEDTDMSIESIAEKCGLGGLVSMRRTFLRHLMTTPSDYRRAFRTSLHDISVNDLVSTGPHSPKHLLN